MKRFSVINIILLSATLILCLFTGCGIPNFSPINILSADLRSNKAVVSGDIISLYSSALRQDEPKICFFYMIAPSGSSYYSSLVSSFSTSYVSNTNMNHISYNSSNLTFLTSRVTYNGNSADVGLYQFTVDSVNTDSAVYSSLKSHLESFISGKSDFTEISSDSYSSSYSFDFDSVLNEFIFTFTDSSGSEKKIYLKRFNDTSFTANPDNDGSAFIGNEIPSGFNFDSDKYSVLIFASAEAAFNDGSFNNVLHSSLKMIDDVTL